MAEAIALHTRARLGQPAQLADRLTELAGQIDGDLVSTRALHAQALAAGDPERLGAVSAAFEALGALLLSAEASADAAVV